MSNLFQTLELEAFRKGITPRTKESRAWFRKRAHDIRRVDRKQLMAEDEINKSSETIVGGMFMFFYDPKHKDTLPYYDTFPLIIPTGPAPGGFYGLNLHYISPILRAKFLDGLLDITNNNRYDADTKFNISYNMLKAAEKYKYFKPCFKHYLTAHVKSRFARVPSTEWEIAVFLPTASWKKGNKTQIYRDSRNIING